MAIMVRNIFSIYTKLITVQSACAERCQSKSFYHETKILLFPEHYYRYYYYYYYYYYCYYYCVILLSCYYFIKGDEGLFQTFHYNCSITDY